MKFSKTVAAIGVIAALTLIYSRLLVVNSTTVALSYLVVVLAAAIVSGIVAAIVASFAGALCLTLFLPPMGRFWVADPEHWVALATFLVTSVVTSQLSARAMTRRTEMEKLYALSRALILLDAGDSIAGQLANHIQAIFGIKGVAVFHQATGQFCSVGPQKNLFSESAIRHYGAKGTAHHDTATGVLIRPLSLSGPSFGSIAFSNPSVSETAQNAITSLAAIALERARIQELAGRVEAIRQSEQLKSTIIDAIAHEFKTPLTSIKAAVSLLENDDGRDRAELLSMIAEDTEYLDSLLSEAIETRRIEAGGLKLDRQPTSTTDVLWTAIRRMGPALKDRTIRREIPDHIPDVLVDRELIGMAIRQLINNAVKYTPPDLPIVIRARDDTDYVQITVEDAGPGIPEPEQSRIFEKYYRIPTTSSVVPGTGMGLTIAREIVEAHGGSVWVQSVPGEGSKFHLTIPYVCRRVPI